MKKKLLLFLVVLLIVSQVSVYAKECPENRIPTINLQETEDLFEDIPYSKKITDYPVSFLSYIEINSSLSRLRLNKETGEINFTPISSDHGTHKIMFFAIDSSECYSSKLVTFKVYDRPRITPIKPGSSFITLEEGHNMLFVVDVVDKDDDITDYAWFINNKRQTGELKEKFAFVTDYDSVGTYNLTLTVTDKKGLNDSYKWRINVKNSNRQPYLSSNLPDYAAKAGEFIST